MNGDPAFDSLDRWSHLQKLTPVRWYDLGTFVFPNLKREIHRFNVSSMTKHSARAAASAHTQDEIVGKPTSSSEIPVSSSRFDDSQNTNSRGNIFELMQELREEPYVKYVRFEMLEYEGSEHYCPLSLVRVYGSTLEEVINLHDQVDDSLIDAIISIPDSADRPAPSVDYTLLKRPPKIINNHPLSLSQYMLALSVHSHAHRFSNKRLSHKKQFFIGDDCINVLNDIEVFKKMCVEPFSRVNIIPSESIGINSYDSAVHNILNSNEKVRSRNHALLVDEEQTNSDQTNFRRELQPAYESVQESDVNKHTKESTKCTFDSSINKKANEKTNLLNFNELDAATKRRNVSSPKSTKSTSTVATNILSNQPVLVRYGNRLNLLELNTTLYAIYLDQLSQHYNAHVNDLIAKFNHISSQLKVQVEQNERLFKLIEQQAMSIELLEHRLNLMESKLLHDFCHTGRVIHLALCYTSFVCLLTVLLSAALNSYHLFNLYGQADEIAQSSVDTVDKACHCNVNTPSIIEQHRMQECTELNDSAKTKTDTEPLQDKCSKKNTEINGTERKGVTHKTFDKKQKFDTLDITNPIFKINEDTR